MAESPHGHGQIPGSPGPLQSHSQTGAVLRVKTLAHSNLGRRKAATQVALSERPRPKYGAPLGRL
eukprot:779712-Alexandrium_andersonii.AAC.1